MKLPQTSVLHCTHHQVIASTTKLIVLALCSFAFLGILLFPVKHGARANEERNIVAAPHSMNTLFQCSQSTSINMTQCDGLLSLFQSTNGPHWTHNDGWLSNNDPCMWYGVTCSGKYVQSLDLSNNNLNGILPLKLSNLYGLEALNVATNTLSGPIPPNMIKLEPYNFKSFFFQATNICEPPDTTFQDWLNAIPTLQRTGILCRTLKVSATTGAPGSEFLLNAANYPANQVIQLLVNNSLLGEVQTNSQGAFSTTLSTPLSETGIYTLTLLGYADSELSLILKKNFPMRKVEKTVTTWQIPSGIALADPLQGSWQCWNGNYPDPCHDLVSIDMLSPIEGWGVGDNGKILHYSNGIWNSVDSPTDNALTAVKIVSSDLAWAVGANGTIIRWDGNVWLQIVNPADRQLNNVDAVSANDAWAIGEKGTILHWDGEIWTQTSTPVTQTLNAIVTPSSNDGWIAGNNGTLLHWNGTNWTQVVDGSLPAATNYSGLSATPTNEVWLSGNDPNLSGSVVARWDDQAESWKRIDFPYSGTYLGRIAMLSSTDGWLVEGREGVVYHWNGNTWDKGNLPAGFRRTITSLEMVDPQNGWVVGDERGLFHWDGTNWTYAVHSELPSYLTDIQMSSTNDGWIVGGKIPLHWNGQTWLSVTVPTEVGLYVLDIVSPNEVWMGGGNSIIRWDGTTWVTFTLPVDDIDMLTSTDGWAVAYKSIFHWDGKAWTEVNNPEPTLGLDSISMLSANNGWAVGGADNYSLILHWDGTAWTKVEAPVSYYIWSVDMLSPTSGWATAWASYVGGKDILYWDGKQWFSHTILPEILADLDMVSENFGWVTGQNRMLWWNGDKWQPRKSPSSASRISTVSPQDAWAIAGSHLLHFVSDVDSFTTPVTPNANSQLAIETTGGVSISIAVPVNAVTQTTNLVLTEASELSVPTNTLAFAGAAFHLDAYQNNQYLTSFQPQQALQVTIHYADIGNEDTLKLYLLEGDTWLDAATTCNPASIYVRNPTNNQISLNICHLSEYALFSEPDTEKTIYLPLIER